jgi:single-stranded DNA-binding protein
MQMLGGRGGGTGGGMGGGERGGSSAGAPPRDEYDQTPAPAGGKEDFDDDIPF